MLLENRFMQWLDSVEIYIVDSGLCWVCLNCAVRRVCLFNIFDRYFSLLV